MFKVNNKDTGTTSMQWCRSGVFIVNFEQISHLVLVFLLLTLNIYKMCTTSKIFFILHEEPCDNCLIASTETNLTDPFSLIVLSLCFYFMVQNSLSRIKNAVKPTYSGHLSTTGTFLRNR